MRLLLFFSRQVTGCARETAVPPAAKLLDPRRRLESEIEIVLLRLEPEPNASRVLRPYKFTSKLYVYYFVVYYSSGRLKLLKTLYV